MIFAIFKKAIKNQKYLKEIGRGQNKIFFEYDFGDKDKNVQVELKVEDNFTFITDTSKAGSINDRALNQYKLGVIFYLFNKFRRQ